MTSEIDLHGYFPGDIENGLLTRIAQQAWETGADWLVLIQGHGRNRGILAGFVNTNTGYLGICIRRVLRHDKSLRLWIKHTTLDCSDKGVTAIKLQCNLNPTREKMDETNWGLEVTTSL
jgi:hypothetical protein